MRRILLSTLAFTLSSVMACGDDVALTKQEAGSRKQEAGQAVYIDGQVLPGADCTFRDIESIGAIGRSDIASGGEPGSRGCEQDYLARLRVNSLLDDTFLVESATVTLLDSNAEEDGEIDFATESLTLANPYTTHTSGGIKPMATEGDGVGAIFVSLIPVEYAALLSNWVGETVIAEVVLNGEKVGGQAVESRSFRYPIEICSGCMTMCLRRDFLDQDLTPEDVLSESVCQDNSGADGRICVDSGC